MNTTQKDILSALRQRAFKSRRKHVIKGLAPDGGDLEVWFRPFTIGDAHKYGKRLDGEDMSAIVELFVEKAEREDGNALFDKTAVPELLANLETDMLVQMSEMVTGGVLTGDTLEGVEGNSAGTPSGS